MSVKYLIEKLHNGHVMAISTRSENFLSWDVEYTPQNTCFSTQIILTRFAQQFQNGGKL